MTASLFAPHALLPGGWAADVRIEVDDAGTITGVAAGGPAEGAERLDGPAVPGMPNLHSHAFQRAMAGLAEVAAGSGDSFWTWRQVMYAFLARLTPQDMETIARQLYIEMLKAGYTAVAEFHYLHNDPDGRAYADPTETSEAVIQAALSAGIGITHLPVLYAAGGFGGAPAQEGQRRFLDDAEGTRRRIEALAARHAGNPQVALGMAPHSLRAVPPDMLRAAVDGFDRPIHIHIAEQRAEVTACLAWSSRRPIGWLLDEMPVDARWCLIHATHADHRELAGIAAAGAVAGLCPTTEANLGDGLFPATAYAGTWGIGSDSHVSVSPVEELRWLEYGQRLKLRGRNLLGRGAANTGAALWRQALVGGAAACGRPVGAIAPGHRADLLVLDGDAPALAGRRGEAILDALVFCGNAGLVRHVMAGGRWQVCDFHHPGERQAAAAFSTTMARLLA